MGERGELSGMEFVDQSHLFERTVNALYKIKDIIQSAGLDTVLTQDAELSEFLENAREMAPDAWNKNSFTEVRNSLTADKQVDLNFGFDIERIAGNMLKPEAVLGLSVDMDKADDVKHFLDVTVSFNGLKNQWNIYYGPGLEESMLPAIREEIIDAFSVVEGRAVITEEVALKVINSICHVFKKYVEFGREDLD